MIRLFEGGRHADLYKKYRRSTPDFVARKVLAYLEEKLTGPHGAAVDVGCGSGQNSLCFAPYFQRILGFDVSPSQVEEARRIPGLPGNVTFGVAPAEQLPVAAGSAELVTGGFSFHWFDFDTFYAEADRVLVGNGVMAAVAHNKMKAVHPTLGEELNALMDAFVDEHLSRKLHERNNYQFNDYKDLPLPYPDEVRLRGMPLDLQLTVADVAGAYTSWSSFQAEYNENPQKMMDALSGFQSGFMRIMGVGTPAEETPITLRYNYCLAMCRKPLVP